MTTGKGSDGIENHGSGVTVNTGAGNDFVQSYGSSVSVNASTGNDQITNNGGAKVTLRGGAGDDTISNQRQEHWNDETQQWETLSPDNALLDGGAGNDNINSYGGNAVSINGGAGNDNIYSDNGGSAMSINGGAGNDYISSYSHDSTIKAGDGDDTVYTTNNDNDRNYIDLGGGANYVFNNGTNTTIKSDSTIGDTIYTCPNSANNVIICGDGPDTLDINGAHSTVNGGGGPDVINNYSKGSSINGGAESDIIDIYEDNSTVNGGSGDDIIYVKCIDDSGFMTGGAAPINSVIDGGDDNDLISNEKNLNKEALKDELEKENDTWGDNLKENFYKNPFMQSVLKDGITSSYLSDFDPVLAITISAAVHSIDEILQKLQNLNSPEEYTTFILKKSKQLGDITSDISTVIPSVSNPYSGLALSGLLWATNERLLYLAEKEFNEKYPNAYEKALIEYPEIKKFPTLYEFKHAGAEPPYIMPTEVYEEMLAERERQIQMEIRKRDPELYDDINLLKFDTESSKKSYEVNCTAIVALGIAVAQPELAPIAESAAILITGIGGAIIKLENTTKKTTYLQDVHGGEQNVIVTFGEQFFNQDYGTVKKILTGKSSNSANMLMSVDEITDVDTIPAYVDAANNTLLGSAGSDMLFNNGAVVTIDTGNDDDIVVNFGDYVKIYGGKNNDSISNGGDYVLLDLGTGNDTVVNAASNFMITSGSGENIIDASGNFNTISVGNGVDFIEYIGDNNSINAGSGDNYLELYGDQNLIETGSGKDYVDNSGNNCKIATGAGNDKVFVNNGFNVTIDAGKGNDTIIIGKKSSNEFVKYTSGNDSIYGFNETSTLSIGNDKGTYSTVVSDTDIIVTVGKGKITLDSAASLSALHINKTNIMDLTLTNASDAKVTLESPIKTANASSRTSAIRIVGNTFNNSIAGGSKNDSLYGGNGDDSLFGGKGNDKLYGQNGDDTLWGGAGNDMLTGGNGNDLFIYSSGNDVITDYATGDKISLSASISSASLNGSDAVLTIGKNTLTITDGKLKALAFINSAGKEFTTIVGGLTLDNSSTSKVTLDPDVEFANASTRTKAITITGNKLSNTILGGSGKDILIGANGNDSLVGNKGNDSLNGGNGNDTLIGGSGNDTFTGGKGNDLFVYTAGNDLITDYATGDKISLGTTIDNSTFDGSDAVLSFGKNTLIIKNGKGKELALIDSTSTERTIIGGSLLLDNNSATKVTLASDVEVADSSSRTSAIRIVANKLANTIFGGSSKDSLYGGKGADYVVGNAGADKLYGQDGNDSLWGGSGNDTLTGGNGSDVFIYNNGEGKDVITDFSNDDLLQITGTFSTVFNSSSNTIAFKVGSTASAVTLKDYTATSFNVNGDSYLINGSKLVKK